MKLLRILNSHFIHSLYFLSIFLIPSIIVAQTAEVDLIHCVDSLVNDAIDSIAFPGAQVLIIHRNKEIINKAYGFHTYDNKIAVEKDHLYDLASVTKIMAGGLSLMKLQEKQKFDVSETLAGTHTFFKKSNKSQIIWKDILSHQSRMQPYIVYWQKTIKNNGKFKWRTFKTNPGRKYNITIDSSLYLHKRYPKKIKKYIRKSPLNDEAKYLYSGLGFLLIPELIHSRSGQSMDHFLKSNYFDPMALTNITFQPYKKFEKHKLIPTEIDTFFRKKLVHSFVHDEAAAMLDGISANAGLFSNAEDLGQLAIMLKDGGEYQGIQFLDSLIVKQYTSVQYPENENRRGLAFDKPNLGDKKGSGYISPSASPSSFGHSGFTGTFVWIDPEFDLIIVFLSNRVYPYRSQRKLYTLNFRPKLHDFAYEYVSKLKETEN